MMRTLALTALLIAVMAPDAVADRDGEVKAISVLSEAGRADVLISVLGSVEFRDFTMDAPSRIVIDVLGARLGEGVSVYDGANRGGIRNVRYAQFRSDVVRVVIELDVLPEYRLSNTEDGILLSLRTERAFASWSTDGPAESGSPDVGTEPLTLEVTPPTADAQQGQPRISVSFQDSTRMVDVIAAFSEFSGRTIVPGRSVDVLVNGLEVRNQPWDVALEAVLDAYGLLAIELPSGIIRVESREELAARDTLQPVETRLIRLNYAKAASLAASVTGMLTPDRGQAVPDTASNSLIVTDIASRVSDIEGLIRALDIRTPQVSIEAKLIFVDRLDVEELGVQYDLGNQNQFFNKLVSRPDPSTAQAVDTDLDGVPDALVPTGVFPEDVAVIDLGGNSLAALGNADAQIINPALDLIFSTALGNFDITAFVSALQRVELADVQAEPTTSVLDNRQAEILVGDRVPIRIIDFGSQGQQGADQPRATVEFEETGVKLRVTPHVTSDRQVLMDIHAERSDVVLAPVDIGFTFQTQQATTQVLVADGETAVIGGLTVTQVTVTKSGIPFLVDLPIIGRLFGFTSERESRRDLLILVTPHIIDDLAAADTN